MKTMDNHQVDQGNVSLAIAVIAGIFARIPHNIGEGFKSFAMLVSVVAGIMAIRYYYYATKKLK